MATYQDIKGLKVKYLPADPSVTVGGEVWYNSTTGTLRSRLVSEAWASSANQINSLSGMGSFGSQTSAVTAGGTPPASTLSEEYNGSGWSAGGALNTARFYLTGAGVSSSSGRVFGGASAPTTMKNENEGYDGTAWTEEGNLNTARNALGGAGTKDAALAFGGGTGPGPSGGADQDVSEEWDGTSWSEGNNLNTARRSLRGAGTQTAGLAIAGVISTNSNLTEEYNGTSWTTGGTVPTGREGMFAWGPQTAAVAAGGQSPFINTTFTYDGTDWSTSPATMGTARQAGGSAGQTGTAGLAAGGETAAPGRPGATEEFNRSTNAITAAAWASGGALNTARRYCVGFGTPTTAVAATGYAATLSDSVEEYDGDTWTAATAIGNARYSASACGTLTAGLVVGGAPGTPLYDLTEEYDGTNWTATGTLNTGRMEASAFGIQTAAVLAGGATPGGTKSGATEEYDGSTWATSPGSLNTPRHQLPSGGAGTLTAGITFGGNDGTPPAPAVTGATETYDGSTWTSGGSLNTARSMVASALQGTTTSALCIAGPTQVIVEAYDGTAWATNPSTTVVHGAAGGVGTQSTGMVFGGRSPSSPTGMDNTELFTGPTSAANIETLTTS